MHFVIHTQYYPPETGAPQARLFALARGLTEHGHRVTVLTAMPNYPAGVIHRGYGGWARLEKQDGVTILRAWIHPTRSTAFIPRLLNYFSFVFSSFWLGLIHLKAPDIILTESPPLFLGISGYLLSRLKSSRWIFNVSDLWPESAVRLGVVGNGPALQLSYWLEGFFYRKAWLVSGQSLGILQSIRLRFPSISLYHLSNGADTDFFTPERSSQRLRNEVGNDVVAIYAGLHGLAQGLDQLLSAAHQLCDLPGFKIVLVGEGPLKKELIARASALNLENVCFMDALPRSEMPGLLAAADICIVPLGLELPGAVPSKLYEAMSAGRAVALMAHGESMEIVRRHDCGLVVPPGDVDALANILRTLALDPDLRKRLGANGRRAAQAHYDHSLTVKKFVDFIVQEQP
jgi:colanic acid biosynthesis glycosyl transferase WcaI